MTLGQIPVAAPHNLAHSDRRHWVERLHFRYSNGPIPGTNLKTIKFIIPPSQKPAGIGIYTKRLSNLQRLPL